MMRMMLMRYGKDEDEDEAVNQYVEDENDVSGYGKDEDENEAESEDKHMEDDEKEMWMRCG